MTPHFVFYYLLPFSVLVGAGLLVGIAVSWWGLIASVGLACFLAYAWELQGEGIAYAFIAGILVSAGVVTGIRLRRRPRP